MDLSLEFLSPKAGMGTPVFFLSHPPPWVDEWVKLSQRESYGMSR